MDSSALIAVLFDEAMGPRCRAALEREGRKLISAGTVAESLIVAGRRNAGEELERLIEVVGLEVVDVTYQTALGVARAYRRWGKGWHAAGLNYGDCFAYELASRLRRPLLYVGDDFAKTDIQSAL